MVSVLWDPCETNLVREWPFDGAVDEVHHPRRRFGALAVRLGFEPRQSGLFAVNRHPPAVPVAAAARGKDGGGADVSQLPTFTASV